MSTKLDLLRRVSLFSGCSERELRKVEPLLDDVSLPKGHVLIREGAVGLEAFVIAEGTAVATVGGSEVGTLGPGDAVGEMALLDRSSPRSATVTATSDLKVLVLDPRSFGRLLDEHPAVTKEIAIGLAKRLRAVENAPTY